MCYQNKHLQPSTSKTLPLAHSSRWFAVSCTRSERLIRSASPRGTGNNTKTYCISKYDPSQQRWSKGSMNQNDFMSLTLLRLMHVRSIGASSWRPRAGKWTIMKTKTSNVWIVFASSFKQWRSRAQDAAPGGVMCSFQKVEKKKLHSGYKPLHHLWFLTVSRS